MMIRDACLADLKFLTESLMRVQDSHVTAYPDVYRPVSFKEALGHLTGKLESSSCFVRLLEHDSEPTGHSISEIQSSSETIFKHPQRFLYLLQIDVIPTHRGKGYGSKFMDDAVQIASQHKLDRIELDVWAFNSVAIHFFESQGFARYGYKLSKSIGTWRSANQQRSLSP